MPVEKCYPSGKNTPLMIAGYALRLTGAAGDTPEAWVRPVK